MSIEALIKPLNVTKWTSIYRVHKKTEQILNRSQLCKIAFGIKFLIHLDHLGSYNVKKKLKKNYELKFCKGGCFFEQIKNALCTK